MNSIASPYQSPLVGDVTTIIVGAGQAGLATSYHLDKQGIDHVLLERGEVGNSWRTERWDSLRLLSPNWQTRLPGQAYQGNDPDGYMPVAELVDFFARYARGINAAIHCNTLVENIRPEGDGYRVQTNRGEWRCRSLVLASGAFNKPLVPAVDAGLPAALTRLTAHQYRNPQALAEGGVLVVGASATGVQIADEIPRSGRAVTLCVGEHVRLPRLYRGKDILWWMDKIGIYGEGADEVDDINRVRRTPSVQLVGSDNFADIDLNQLQQRGIRLAGRLMSASDGRLQFSGGLNNLCKLADLKMHRLLKAVDEWIAVSGQAAPAAAAFEPTRIAQAPLDLDLNSGEIKTVIWACGFKPDYSWLSVPVLDHKGRLRHNGGITPSPGLYAMGLPVMRRRNSAFIYGVAEDAQEIAAEVAAYIGTAASKRKLAVA